MWSKGKSHSFEPKISWQKAIHMMPTSPPAIRRSSLFWQDFFIHFIKIVTTMAMARFSCTLKSVDQPFIHNVNGNQIKPLHREPSWGRPDPGCALCIHGYSHVPRTTEIGKIMGKKWPECHHSLQIRQNHDRDRHPEIRGYGQWPFDRRMPYIPGLIGRVESGDWGPGILYHKRPDDVLPCPSRAFDHSTGRFGNSDHHLQRITRRTWQSFWSGRPKTLN